MHISYYMQPHMFKWFVPVLGIFECEKKSKGSTWVDQAYVAEGLSDVAPFVLIPQPFLMVPTCSSDRETSSSHAHNLQCL